MTTFVILHTGWAGFVGGGGKLISRPRFVGQHPARFLYHLTLVGEGYDPDGVGNREPARFIHFFIVA